MNYSRRLDLSFEHVKPVRPVSPDEFACLRLELAGRDRLIVDCLYLAGLRPGELVGGASGLGLRWCDISDDPGGEHSLSVYWGKTRRFRNAVMFQPLFPKLAAHRTLSGAGHFDFVFPAKDGGSWSTSAYGNWTNRVFNPAVRRAGLRSFTPFDLRHGYAELTYRAGKRLWGVSEAVDISPEQARFMYSSMISVYQHQLPIVPEVEIRAARENARKEKEGE